MENCYEWGPALQGTGAEMGARWGDSAREGHVLPAQRFESYPEGCGNLPRAHVSASPLLSASGYLLNSLANLPPPLHLSPSLTLQTSRSFTLYSKLEPPAHSFPLLDDVSDRDIRGLTMHDAVTSTPPPPLPSPPAAEPWPCHLPGFLGLWNSISGIPFLLRTSCSSSSFSLLLPPHLCSDLIKISGFSPFALPSFGPLQPSLIS